MEATLLTDRTRLQEIYNLRVIAFEHSPYGALLNRGHYPHGFFDKLDPRDSTYHLIVEVDLQIVGAVRIATIYDIHDIEEEIEHLPLPEERPFGFCGRTVVHPDYRNTKVIYHLDYAMKNFLVDHPWLHFGFGYIIPERLKAMTKFGFQYLGDITYEWSANNKSLMGAYIIKPGSKG